MDLQRKEYPAMLESLQPGQAVTVLNERIRHVSRLNTEIADWLQERRRVEELYVQGLRKLANKHPPDESSDLGIFSTPWQRIVSSAEALADSHHQLAQKIEADVERPLRDFAASNREMQAMSTISGNLSAMAKEIDNARKKADRLKDKGAKAAAGKVATATSDVENATSQWDSQAPYVFEKLQAVDESRLNHLRDALTQFQTHEVDQVERNRVNAEETLNVLLNVETVDEIKTFSLKTVSGKPKTERKQSSISTPSRSLAPPPPPPPTTPSTHADDGSSQRSGSVQETKHGGLHSLKRFGTVLRSRRQSTHPYGRNISPERKSASNLGATFASFGNRGKAKEGSFPIPADRPGSPSRRLSGSRPTPRASDGSSSPKQARRTSSDKPNGTSLELNNEPSMSSAFVNGTARESIPELQEPLQPIIPSVIPQPEPEKDSEGYTVPPSATDAISQAEQEAIGANETPTPQFKVDIRNAPIQEEDGDAETVLANVANTLRAQAAPTRKPGTVRGRRDVRNTIFVPNPQTPELTSIGETYVPSVPALATVAALPAAVSLPASPPGPPPVSPFKLGHRHTFLGDDHATSDTQSIRSGRSLSSSGSSAIKHPDMHGPGLNTSLVETVSAWLEHGSVAKAMVIGQVALAYNPVDLSSPFGTDNIRLENFPVLEKVAPNPAFIEQVPELPGSYTVDLSKITKTSVAFHYQVHLDSSNLATYAPLIISPAWRVEATQTSALLSYSLNPAFALGSAPSITLHNLVLIVHLEPGVKTTHCQSKPVGTFSREKALIYWRLGDVTLSPDQPAQQLRARFFTDGEAKPGNVEARWEVSGDHAAGLGSGLSVSQLNQAEVKTESEADPFADADENIAPASPAIVWKEVQCVKRIASGTYVAI
ncbi:hypothetical protein K432DRAFT_332433 [Lepidopterella palustris CBS 459.81]|uniref:MHD domain-containing protein n=1 Tax=Lepidopterella palustris CBS 459.81 TaxID=1314670 RepID=A0A8E2JDB0_9PEZI|nr:hypothetical protein K432DRAFT_332433 [Lepidopterella palustris CBS 459.81]